MKDRVRQQIAGLRGLTHEELKAQYVTLYGSEPPVYNRAFIISRLAYRIQELTYGGLSNTARTRMRQVLQEHGYDERGIKKESAGSKRSRPSADMPVLGTRLIREFKGVAHEVTVVPGGFEYRGKRYRSLTAATRAITGSHWNGQQFFGLDVKGNSR